MSYTDDYNWRATWTNDQLTTSRDSYLYQLSRSLRSAAHQLDELLAIHAEFDRRASEKHK